MHGKEWREGQRDCRRTVNAWSPIGTDKLHWGPVDSVDDISVPVLELDVRELDTIAVDSGHTGPVLVDVEAVGSSGRTCAGIRQACEEPNRKTTR